MVNIKPSRIGGLKKLCDTYDYCAERQIGAYGGGQFELGPGRGQAQYLASLFHPDTPNDLAPTGYNQDDPRRAAFQPAAAERQARSVFAGMADSQLDDSSAAIRRLSRARGQLDGTVALVTGAWSGIGAASAGALAGRGACRVAARRATGSRSSRAASAGGRWPSRPT